jgi:hypothetical protein
METHFFSDPLLLLVPDELYEIDEDDDEHDELFEIDLDDEDEDDDEQDEFFDIDLEDEDDDEQLPVDMEAAFIAMDPQVPEQQQHEAGAALQPQQRPTRACKKPARELTVPPKRKR